MPLLSGRLSHSYLPEVAIISINHSVPCYGLWINIKPRESLDFLLGQIIGVTFLNTKFFESFDLNR